jgi:hypothetical protein
MGQKTNNLHAFTIDKDNIKEGLISLFDMDEDYNGGNGDEYWEFSDQKDEDGNLISLAVLEGFKTEAERFVYDIYTYSHSDGVLNQEQCIASTLYKVQACHGSHSEQFTFVIVDTGPQFIVAVSYLT